VGRVAAGFLDLLEATLAARRRPGFYRALLTSVPVAKACFNGKFPEEQVP
jgi:hypothetical protein